MGGDVMLSATERRDSFSSPPLEKTLSKLASFKRQASSGSVLCQRTNQVCDGSSDSERPSEVARGPSALADGALLQRQASPAQLMQQGSSGTQAQLMRQGSLLSRSV